jgi:hypothetical protein
MKKKGHRPGPVPPGNRPKAGPELPQDENRENEQQPQDGAAFSEQDPKRRLGGYQTAGEHAIVQPGGKNDADR